MLASIHDHDPQIAYRGDVFSLGCILFELLTGTVLGIQLFDQQFKADLAQAMGAVGKEHRQRIFHEFLTNIVGTHPLPHLGAFQADVPSSLLPELDGLYKSMAALDHRQRICDYERIFLRLDRCIWILRNQENYRRWRARREQFRRMHEQKLARREAVRNSQKASGK
jgi:serine/threonine protein kinase